MGKVIPSDSEFARVLDECHGNTAAAAKILGVTSQTIRNRAAKSAVIQDVIDKWQREIAAALAMSSSASEAAELAGVSIGQVNAYIQHEIREEKEPEEPEESEEEAPAAPSPVAAAHERRTILPYYQDRRPATIQLFRTPSCIKDVYQMEFKDKGGPWYPVVLWIDPRICTGPDVPEWGPDQVTYRNVEHIRITYRDGRVEVFNHDPSEPITMAP